MNNMKTVSYDDIERLCKLHTQLKEASVWAKERSEKIMKTYLEGGGRLWDTEVEPRFTEDSEIEAIVKCSLGDQDPAFNPADEYGNLLAVSTHVYNDERDDEWSWNEGVDHIEALKDTRVCFLFHDIFDHQLHMDIEAVCRIGEIQTDVVFTRQRMLYLDKTQLPRKRKSSYSRSVFDRTPIRYSSYRRQQLTAREERYARLLNQYLLEAQIWINDQIRRAEEEYRMVGGLSGPIDDTTYEDYEMRVDICPTLGENHPEYDDEDDNILVKYYEPVHKRSQHVFGRARSQFYDPYLDHNILERQRDGWFEGINNLRACRLFHCLWDELGRDWLKMLSIGQIWIDVFIVHRRIVHF